MRISSGCKMRLCKQRASLCAQHTAGTQPRLAPVAAETGTSHHPAAGTSLPFPVQYSAVAKGMNSRRTTELSYLSAGGALAVFFTLPIPPASHLWNGSWYQCFFMLWQGGPNEIMCVTQPRAWPNYRKHGWNTKYYCYSTLPLQGCSRIYLKRQKDNLINSILMSPLVWIRGLNLF